MENKIIYQCEKCSKKYKTKVSLDKHLLKCKVVAPTSNVMVPQQDEAVVTDGCNSNQTKENNYDVNMTFLEGNKVKLEMKKQMASDAEEGEKVLKEILKPKVSESYQEEIDKLEDMITMFKDFPVPENPESKDATIAQLKNIISITMTQSQNLIKEMKEMSKKNSYYKNNIMLAAFVLDKCRKDVPDEDEDDGDDEDDLSKFT